MRPLSCGQRVVSCTVLFDNRGAESGEENSEPVVSNLSLVDDPKAVASLVCYLQHFSLFCFFAKCVLPLLFWLYGSVCCFHETVVSVFLA
jgi:hypothetical protein